MRRSIMHILYAILLFVLGCATTSLSAIKNPDFNDVKLQKILVIAPFQDIGIRQQTEDSFESYWTWFRKTLHSDEKRNAPDAGCFISSIAIIPPFKDYSQKELQEKIDQAGIDGILVVALEDYWTSQTYVPSGSSTHGSAQAYGNSLYYQSYTRKWGGYSVSKPRMKFDIRLFDVKTGEIIWMASSFTKGNAFADYGDLVGSLSSSVVDKLYHDGYLNKQQ